ncbi:hypothetical protein AERO_14290 [Aeromicrobium fastidiosum]|uniref:hypothetical protein n=1 Tax=Aeromicrobium fastidiosum TaxID=52699 RepID=UPI0020232F2D|nr:hypothetical protein [Aeromicrobium fastidiosum]MCL8252556.1 hypothetical protein [Aeromicrobium fastidiosum]
MAPYEICVLGEAGDGIRDASDSLVGSEMCIRDRGGGTDVAGIPAALAAVEAALDA